MRISGWTATLLYSVAAAVMTWPLARGLTHDIPGDLGDSLLNCWVVSWVADHLLRALGGDVAALGQFWHANIFYPEPYALAYSEHLTAQAVQILPIYAATHNPILSYNLLFLSTFVLSGLGMFLLVRSLTQDAIAGLVAGAIYAFGLPRVGQIPHLQVLSAQWMPFALLGVHRFFETRRLAPLIGASAALIAQNLSCGYYVMFFMPVVVGVAAFEIGTQRLWRVLVGDEIPDVYKAVQHLPPSSVVAEFPFGEIAYELRYLYYSIFHWRPLVNGYSGAFPISYQIRSTTLVHPLFEPAPAWNTLLATGATHAIVHRLAYQKDDGDRMVDWFRDRGATVLSDTGEAVLFELPARGKLQLECFDSP